MIVLAVLLHRVVAQQMLFHYSLALVTLYGQLKGLDKMPLKSSLNMIFYMPLGNRGWGFHLTFA